MQPRQEIEPIGILRQTPVANLAVAEHAFNHSEGMLHFGSNAGFDRFAFLCHLRHRGALTRPLSDKPIHFTVLVLFAFLDAAITRISPDPLLFTMQKLA